MGPLGGWGMARMYRTMKADVDGGPTVGIVANTLGARPSKDIPVDESGSVEPQTGGMSVTLEDPRLMSRPFRPRELGGESRHPLFEMDSERLPAALTHRPAPPAPGHHVVEPAERCLFSEYVGRLHATRPWWKRGSHESL